MESKEEPLSETFLIAKGFRICQKSYRFLNDYKRAASFFYRYAYRCVDKR